MNGRAEIIAAKIKAREHLKEADSIPIPPHGSCEGGIVVARLGRYVQGKGSDNSTYVVAGVCPGIGKTCYSYWQKIEEAPWEQVVDGAGLLIPADQILSNLPRVTRS